MSKYFTLTGLTLFVALALSAVAAYYSIAGLTAIFAGAVIPVIVMGSILEVAKLVATVWLKSYWTRVSVSFKLYLIPSIVILMLITSMGIFGFLSKAHMDQGMTSGDVLAKISVYDEKIKTSKENIDGNRKLLKQMDDSVDQVMGRTTDAQGAVKAVAVRKGQQKERTRIQSEITTEQKTIASLNEARAPIAAEVRKVEAEVGPIKYIAAFIYGDNPDQNVLERAVRWMIILLIVVFDPLAVALLLASNQSKQWDKEAVLKQPDPESLTEVEEEVVAEVVASTLDDYENPSSKLTNEELAALFPPAQQDPHYMAEAEPEVITSDDTLTAEFSPAEIVLPVEEIVPVTFNSGSYANVTTTVKPIDYVIPELHLPEEMTEEVEIVTEGVTQELAEPEVEKPYVDLPGGYVAYQGKHMNKAVLKDMRPDLFRHDISTSRAINTNFGHAFPGVAFRGDVFVRVDILPNQVYKFDGTKWISIDKEQTDSYLHNLEYIKYLVSKIESGEYDIDLVTDHEKQEIEEYLKGK